eukprot:4805618-Pleurochrysis_carterae.AAC.1
MHDGNTMQAMTQYNAMDDGNDAMDDGNTMQGMTQHNAMDDGNTMQGTTAIQCNARRQCSAMHDGNTVQGMTQY